LSVTDRHRISVVAGDLFARRPLAALLWQGRSAAVSAADRPGCRAAFGQAPTDLNVLDVVTPGTDGFQVGRSVKSESN
jgi:DNA-binding response OmpR family regulator